MEYCELNKDKDINIKILPRCTGKTIASINYIIEKGLKQDEVFFITPNKKYYKDFYKHVLNFEKMNVISFKEFVLNILDTTFEMYLNVLKQYKLIVFDDIPQEEALIYAVSCYLLMPGMKVIFVADKIE